MRPLIIAILFWSKSCYSQDSLLYNHLPVIDGRVFYSKVIPADSVDRIKLFMILKDWAVDTYESQKNTLEAEDKEGGYLVYKGWFYFPDTLHGGIFNGKPTQYKALHKLKFYIKDNKIKVTISDLETVDFWQTVVPVEKWGDDLKKLNEKRQGKARQYLESSAKSLNVTIIKLFSHIESAVKKAASQKDYGF